MESVYRKVIAQNISKLRKKTELSEFAFAIKAGIDPKTLRSAEHTAENLEFSTLDKVAKALGVPTAELLEGIPGTSSELNFLADLLSGNLK